MTEIQTNAEPNWLLISEKFLNVYSTKTLHKFKNVATLIIQNNFLSFCFELTRTEKVTTSSERLRY